MISSSGTVSVSIFFTGMPVRNNSLLNLPFSGNIFIDFTFFTLAAFAGVTFLTTHLHGCMGSAFAAFIASNIGQVLYRGRDGS